MSEKGGEGSRPRLQKYYKVTKTEVLPKKLGRTTPLPEVQTRSTPIRILEIHIRLHMFGFYRARSRISRNMKFEFFGVFMAGWLFCRFSDLVRPVIIKSVGSNLKKLDKATRTLHPAYIGRVSSPTLSKS